MMSRKWCRRILVAFVLLPDVKYKTQFLEELQKALSRK